MTTGETFAIFAGGGTGGHVLPGLAVARSLVARGHDPSTIHFVGSDTGVEERLVPAAGFTVDELPGRGIQRRLTLANVTAVLGIVRGVLRAVSIVRRRRPQVVVVLGGYASVAVGLTAVVLRVPIVVLEQNARAGAANRLLGRFAAAAAVSFAGTDLPRGVLTGNPLRPEIRDAAVHRDRDAAAAALGLPAERIIVAVYSGSLGSRRINEAVRGLVARWKKRDDIAIRHVIGRRDYEAYMGASPLGAPDVGDAGLVYQAVEYEDRIDLLLASADIAVTRAGGGVAELAALGVPAVLVPLPIATRDHQTANGRVLATSGAAVLVPDDELTAERLEAELSAILDDPARREAMAVGMRAHAHLDAADRVAELVEENARG
ncbi:MAG TPA: UDP-N-acetylglucosamine--N-acetylmuramyl-(pentapeptide) pyrophosphoryl-undecaprenol N-acetylglucosamine transferase [Acidimicrobiales bacterium]|nr:UDP-N-acetylglucosamine--N-acetylmuramyl-(pentapeptide) pyrophosphoryl-undecaprenol N-acetylglucosamine transferase [Acidimicrobiales bacterium]